MESLYEAWERFKDLLQRCPHHGLPIRLQLQTFYNRLLPNIQVMIDAASGGGLNNKTPEDAYKLIEVMASNNYMRLLERNVPRRVAGVHEVDGYTTLEIIYLEIAKQEVCLLNPNKCIMSTIFKKAWENHPNFVWSNNNEHKPPPSFQPQEKRSNMESVLTKFMEESGNRSDKNEAQLQKYEVLLQNQSASIRNLETQMGLIYNILAGTVQGTLPSDTEKNLKERINAIMVRSGKELKEASKEGETREKLEDEKEGRTKCVAIQGKKLTKMPML
ncbi:uncharacterized protein LOC116141879 [Pistacia vera]|uniref:uncharacterized protein LOC116141879 n=1 Tax=Pistacia vera TaxID=55513 RepID=UPI0012632C7E|nr:uncharacterized protein LOC116141879 [Pistacia vera]